MEKENIKVTIIVAVYNMSKYLGRCLESICRQTYSNLEIIVVDDGSTDNSHEIVAWFASTDSRVKLLLHSKNEGLFAARITGIKQASGEYLAFVDSDDYISIDFIRSLLSSAEESQADVAVAKTVHEADGIGRYVHTMYHSYDFSDVKAGQVFSKYMEQEGKCYIWHTVWNKLYKKSVWDRAMPTLTKIARHIIMTEDVLFSTIVMSGVKSIVSSEYAYYFYYQHNSASTSLHGGVEKFEKNIGDLTFVFSTVEEYITENCEVEDSLHFEHWKALYARFWVDNIKNSALQGKEKEALLLKVKVGMEGKGEGTNPEDHHFYKITMPWDGRYNDIVERLATSEFKYCSFDIFDTLVTRPYHEPKDMFEIMNTTFYKLFNRNDNFASNRIFAEQIAREKNLTMQDVTMKDIYFELHKIFGYDEEKLKELARVEEELEIASCNARKSAKNLYELMVHLGIKVICISDMYLRQSVVRKILAKNGYDAVEKIYISGDIGLSKRGRSLYSYVMKDCKIRSEDIVHIGDNWDSDKLAPEEIGISGIFYPSCKEVFMNMISDIAYSDTASKYNKPTGTWLNLEAAMQYFGTRCALAVSYNRMCDNPYASYKDGSNFNASPQFMGGYPLGMHLLGVVKFIHEKAENYKKIHFIARDGYLPMLGYNTLYDKETSYLHISRKSLFPLTVRDEYSFMQLGEYAKWKNSTPRKIINLILPTLKVDNVEEIILPKKVILDKPFKSYEEYIMVIKSIVERYFSSEKLAEYKQLLRTYFSKKIGREEIAFDIGYSGRSQVLLSELLGYRIDAIYIHSNASKFKDAINRAGIKIHTFYNFTPSITGGIREVVMSSCEPSTIGYSDKNDAVIFEEREIGYEARYVIEEMQRAAIKYLRDIKETLLSIEGITMELLDWRNIDISAPFEMLMHHASVADREVFSVFKFEDELHDGRKSIKLSEIWGSDIAYHYSGERFSNNYFDQKYSVYNASMWKKFVFYWLFDKERLKSKINSKLSAKNNIRA